LQKCSPSPDEAPVTKMVLSKKSCVLMYAMIEPTERH
jgi:hypothetical protein